MKLAIEIILLVIGGGSGWFFLGEKDANRKICFLSGLSVCVGLILIVNNLYK